MAHFVSASLLCASDLDSAQTALRDFPVCAMGNDLSKDH